MEILKGIITEMKNSVADLMRRKKESANLKMNQ